ncbi:MAG: serine hydrolase domain-containing protein [Thiohalomonadales bacterium]
MNHILRKILFIILVFLPLDLVLAECVGVNKSKIEKVVTRATNNALPAAGIYYQKKDCVIKITKGYSNLKTKVKINKNPRFDIGSITKTFVAVSSIKLARAGVFNLDDTLVKWLPAEITDHIPNSNIITIRNLLSHTSGIDDYLHIAFSEIYLSSTHQIWTELEVLKFVFDKPLLFETGTGFEYSNTNYLLMGLIINAATNKHFSTVIRELIIEPLGLKNTFHMSEKNNYLDYVHGYFDRGLGVLQDGHDMAKITPFAESAMISSLQDLAVFIQAIFTDKTFMDDASLTTLLSSPVNSVDSFYGLGIGIGASLGLGQIDTGIDIRSDKVAYGHGGSEYGYETYFQYRPGTKETTVIFATGGDGVMAIFGKAYTAELKREFVKSQWPLSILQ